MVTLPTLPTRRRRASSFGSQGPLTRRPATARIRRGGLFSTRVCVCALTRGLTWASSTRRMRPHIVTPRRLQERRMRRKVTSELYLRAENTSPNGRTGRSWSESVLWGMPYGCQNCRGAATSGLSTLMPPNRIPLRANEDWRPSLDVDAQTHQTAEQDVQVASAALLEGEEKRTPSVSSEQAAAPGTPSTFDTPSLSLPRLPIQRPHPSRADAHARARTQTLVHRARFSDRESGAPWHLSPLGSLPACAPLGPSRKTQTKQGE